MVSAWRPKDEAEAASAMAGFIAWLRANGHGRDATPAIILAWAATRAPEFDAALAGFLGWRDGPHLPRKGGEAVVLHRGGQRHAWPHDGLPACIADRLHAADAIGLAAFHLLEHNTCPDDRLLWLGDPGDALPLGALYVGATIILADAPTAALAAAERATLLRPPP